MTKMQSCIFCQIVSRQVPAFIVYEDESYLAFLDKFPQTRGHVQLIPKTHVRWVYDIPNIGQFFTVAGRIIHAIIPVLDASHVTIGTFGREIDHAHLWIVPQYGGDRLTQEGYGRRSKEEGHEEVAKNLREGLSKMPA